MKLTLKGLIDLLLQGFELPSRLDVYILSKLFHLSADFLELFPKNRDIRHHIGLFFADLGYGLLVLRRFLLQLGNSLLLIGHLGIESSLNTLEIARRGASGKEQHQGYKGQQGFLQLRHPLNSRTLGAAAERWSEVFLNEIGAKGQQQKPSKIVSQSRKGDQAGFDPSPRIRILVPLAFMTAILFTPPLFRVKAR